MNENNLAEQNTLNKNTNQTERTTQNSFGFWLLFLAVLIFIDQGVKYFVFSRPEAGFLNFLEPVFREEKFQNYNFAFSLPIPVWAMYGIYAFILISSSIYFVKHFKKLDFISIFGWMLIFAGAISNVAERIVLGYVRDFIYFSSGIFNFADIYILLGIALLVVQSLIYKRDDS